MALDVDALNYPYIRIRNVDWLKRTLLVFPHVVRIAPSYGAPDDGPDVAEFRDLMGRRGPLLRNVDLTESGVWEDQRELQRRITRQLNTNGEAFVRHFGKDACEHANIARESTELWNNRLASRTFQLHGQKVLDGLLELLTKTGLAWLPKHSDGEGYVEMHPRLGEAVLSTLAFACAKNEGLRLVTEFPKIFGRTIHRSKEEIFDSILGIDPISLAKRSPEPTSLVEFVVYHRCDVSKLTPDALLEVNKEWEAMGAFKDGLEKMATAIPLDIANPKVLRQRFNEKSDEMFSQWRKDSQNFSSRLKELFAGDGEDAAKVVEKLVEKGFSGEAAGGGAATTLVGAITHNTLVAAGAGLAIAIVVRTGKNIVAARKKRRESPLRYLTMIEKAGVCYTTAAESSEDAETRE